MKTKLNMIPEMEETQVIATPTGMEQPEERIPVAPIFHPDDPEKETVCRRVFHRAAARFSSLTAMPGQFPPVAAARDIRAEALIEASREAPGYDRPLRLSLYVLTDLVCQGWRVLVGGGQEAGCEAGEGAIPCVTVSLLRPLPGNDRQADKERVRRSLVLARDEQLSEPPIRTFVRAMEARRLIDDRWVSIHSLMADGTELADRLGAVAALPSGLGRDTALSTAVAPYVQVITDEFACCEHTGLRLMDIWRYFRYTWLNPARSTPGRTMMILVRDAAAENHPVIGIAALSSAIVQQSERDRIIGWTRDAVVADLEARPTDASAEWLLRSLDSLLGAIYSTDLVSPDEAACPTPSLIEQLQKLGQEEKRRHYQNARIPGYRQKQEKDDWAALVKTHLFTSKRALTLADLLTIRLRFQELGFTEPNGTALAKAIEDGGVPFRHAIGRLVRHIKATRVGINMMDISVCGAVAPYNAVLGGKLVSLLLTSPEIRCAYARRYGGSQSIIASSMLGAPVRRDPQLVLLCTTGLFAGGSSQYNRVRIPADVLGGKGEVRYTKLGQETEFATFHISQATQREMLLTLESEDKGSNVNSIFGEGVNPRMRKISDGLNRAGFSPEHVLRAGSPRAVYMVPLAHNYRDVLLGRTQDPNYILPLATNHGDNEVDAETAATGALSAYWRRRWLDGRIQQSDVISTLRHHDKTHPLLHGALVTLPDVPDEQTSFEDALFGSEDVVLDNIDEDMSV